jgi:hypothetical protein
MKWILATKSLEAEFNSDIERRLLLLVVSRLGPQQPGDSRPKHPRRSVHDPSPAAGAVSLADPLTAVRNSHRPVVDSPVPARAWAHEVGVWGVWDTAEKMFGLIERHTGLDAGSLDALAEAVVGVQQEGQQPGFLS